MVETENWLITQRLASLSYSTMGSPSLFSAQPPPNPDHRTLPATGPATRPPLLLLKMAKSVFTHCTYWVAPTAPLVSGGEYSTMNPYLPLPSPSKLLLIRGVYPKVRHCRTGSSGKGVKPRGSRMGRTGSASC